MPTPPQNFFASPVGVRLVIYNARSHYLPAVTTGLTFLSVRLAVWLVRALTPPHFTKR